MLLNKKKKTSVQQKELQMFNMAGVLRRAAILNMLEQDRASGKKYRI